MSSKFDQLMKKDHYRSILYLTLFFGEENGLRMEDYRFILIQDHDGINQTDVRQKWIKRLKKGYGNFLVSLHYDLILRGSVTSGTNLSNFLHKLVHDYNLMEKYEKDQVPYYKIKEECKFLPLKKWLKDIIEKCPNEYIQDLTNSFFEAYLDILIRDDPSIKKRPEKLLEFL